MMRDAAKEVMFAIDLKVLHRFWSKVDMSGDCWLWTAQTNRQGYGRFSVEEGGKWRVYQAHRVSAVLHGSLVGPMDLIMHSCDTPSCVNPKHLSVGTEATNRADCVEKRRQARGVAVGGAKLDESTVREIRTLLAAGAPGVSVARKFGLTNSSVSSIRNFHTWRHVQ